MINLISTDQLKPGMYIHDLNCGWLDHPFISNAFAVRDQATVDKIVGLGIREVYIDTARGIGVREAPTQKQVNADLDRRLQELAEKPPVEHVVAELREETAKARRLHSEANKVMRNVIEDVRLGKAIEIGRVAPLVENTIESIFRNQNALLPLVRLKSHDDYTFEHSVSVCALLVVFGKAMQLPRDVIREIALGGMLHDVGKAQVPDDILNKPGKLDDEEFTEMRRHVALGVNMLKKTEGISEIAMQVVAQHHERADGTGYPARLEAAAISTYGRMAAIVDVYDAISSERVYHKGMPPPQALKKMLEWSSHHFDPQLVKVFIRAVGIYPTGTLVQLESKRLAVVIEQNEGNLLQPVVRVFYHAGKRYYIRPEIVDLSKIPDKITSFENYEKWNIDPYQWLPS